MNEIGRREFIRISVLATAGAAAAACAKTAEPTIPPTEAPTATTQPAAEATATPKPAAEATATPKPAVQATATPTPAGKEAPMLAELVETGKLPPVEKRLPQNPGELPVMEQVGNYGGTIRRGFRGVSDRWGPTKIIQRYLMWYTPDLEVRPHMAEAWEVNEDATEWTWHLRKGMNWSDGNPFTSEAFTWYYEFQLLNEELTPSPPGDWSTGTPSVLMEVEAADDYTVVTRFAHPNPLVANKWNRSAPFEPGHYLKQFHIELTEDKAALEEAIKDAGFSSWVEYFADREWWYLNPDKPDVGAWVSENSLSGELFVMRRNPYFFGVDPDGNQLPYVDRITHRLYNTPDVFNMWIVNGEIDFQARGVSMADYTLFKENEAKGDYWVALAITPMHVSLFPNQTCPDPRIREFNQNRDVRIAVSLAINRDEINQLVWDGLFTPRQYSPLEEAAEYYPKAANAYIEYDPDKANELLDQAGYDQRDSEGFRLWKDGSGESISIVMEGTSVSGEPMEDAGQMVVRYLEDVGLKVSYKAVERSLYEEHYSSNNIQWAWWTSDYTMLPLIMPHTWLATMLDNPWAVGWGQYLIDPTSPIAEEPPEGHWIWDIWDIWANEVAVELDAEKRIELFHKILDIFATEMPMPTILGEAPGPCIVKNGLRNYVEGYPDDGRLGNESFLGTETYFWEEPEKHA